MATASATLTGWPMKDSAIHTSLAPKKTATRWTRNDAGEAAMIAPNLLQPAAEIGDVIESRPVVLLAECDKPPHERFESAEIQGQEEAAHRRQRDCQHDEGQGREPMRPGEIEDDADPGCHKDQEAHHLDKNVDQDAGDRHICGHAELGKQPRADDVAADADERNQRIDRFANESQGDENVWATCGGVSRNHQPTPAAASAIARAITTSAVPHCELTRACKTEAKPK